MYNQKFREAVAFVLENEGGYANHPNDPGGETNFGISKRSYPNLDIKYLTKERAIEIYYHDFWKPARLDKVRQYPSATKIFDMCVNMGQRTAYTLVQRACWAHGYRIAIDGLVGPETLDAVNSIGKSIVPTLRAEMAARYRMLIERNRSLAVFEDGWRNRAYK